MTELKTLNDIMNSIPYEEVTRTRIADELRAEAVKWAKNYKAGVEYHDKQALNKMITFEDSQNLNSQLESRIDFIKHFFNLTEEELK